MNIYNIHKVYILYSIYQKHFHSNKYLMNYSRET
jgi:hypothetical protein